ncbi:hypothetical protein P9112_005394 [Eukaryota sp. TZLM1-RC]
MVRVSPKGDYTVKHCRIKHPFALKDLYKSDALAIQGFCMLLVILIVIFFVIELNTSRPPVFQHFYLSVISAVLGWTAYTIIVFMVGLGTRNKLLEKLLSLEKMWTLHRHLDPLVLFLVVCHAYLRRVSQGYHAVYDAVDILAYVFKIEFPDIALPEAIYQRESRRLAGQFAMYSMTLISVLSFFRRLPSNLKSPFILRLIRIKGFIPWWFWRLVHFEIYFALYELSQHMRSAAYSSNSVPTLFGSRSSIYNGLHVLLVMFLAPRILQLFTKRRPGSNFHVVQSERISDGMTRVVLARADNQVLGPCYGPASFVVLQRPSRNPFAQSPHPLSLASLPDSVHHELVLAGGTRLAREARNWEKGQTVRIDGYYGHLGRNILANKNVTIFSSGVGIGATIGLVRFFERIADFNRCDQTTTVPLPNLHIILEVECPNELGPIGSDLCTLAEFGKSQGFKVCCILVVAQLNSLDNIVNCLCDDVVAGRVTVDHVCSVTSPDTISYVLGGTSFVSRISKYLKQLGLSSNATFQENFLM